MDSQFTPTQQYKIFQMDVANGYIDVTTVADNDIIANMGMYLRGDIDFAEYLNCINTLSKLSKPKPEEPTTEEPNEL